MRAVLSITMVLSAIADAACAPALTGASVQTGSTPGSVWVKFFFNPTGNVAFGINNNEVWTWDYSTSPSARTKISSDTLDVWATGSDLGTQGMGSITFYGGVMTADASHIFIAAGNFIMKVGTASPYAVSSDHGVSSLNQVNNGCADGYGPEARYTNAAGIAFANAAESMLLLANFGCAVLQTVEVATLPFPSTTVVGTLSAPGNTDGYGVNAALTNPRSLVHWRNRFFLTSEDGARISVLWPNGWLLAKVSGASSPPQTTTSNVAFTGFAIIVAANNGIPNQINVWSDCSLVVWQDQSGFGHIVDPDADMTYLITGIPAAYFVQQDPLGNVWVSLATPASSDYDVLRYALGGCDNTISPHSCKWPTASSTVSRTFVPLPASATSAATSDASGNYTYCYKLSQSGCAYRTDCKWLFVDSRCVVKKVSPVATSVSSGSPVPSTVSGAHVATSSASVSSAVSFGSTRGSTSGSSVPAPGSTAFSGTTALSAAFAAFVALALTFALF